MISPLGLSVDQFVDSAFFGHGFLLEGGGVYGVGGFGNEDALGKDDLAPLSSSPRSGESKSLANWVTPSQIV